MVSSQRISLALLLFGSAVAFASDTPKKGKAPETVAATDPDKASKAKAQEAKATGAQQEQQQQAQAQQQEQEARPEAAAAAPYAEFQFATLTGTSNVLNATLVPVVTASGTTYVNVTLTFNVAANGTITVAAGSPAVVASPIVGATSFKAGNYIAPSNVSNGKGLVTVNGPGVVAGGASVWTLTTAAGADACSYPASATWYVASPTATNNPMAARLKNAGITSTAYSYGVTGDQPCIGAANWYSGSLIGVSQSGNSITIVSFSDDGSYEGGDRNTPYSQITYVLH
jgi:hypothetical protein